MKSMKIERTEKITITKPDIAKMFGFIVTNIAKETITNNLSRYKIGSKAGHRPQENMFTIRSLISLYNISDKPVLICLL